MRSGVEMWWLGYAKRVHPMLMYCSEALGTHRVGGARWLPQVKKDKKCPSFHPTTLPQA